MKYNIKTHLRRNEYTIFTFRWSIIKVVYFPCIRLIIIIPHNKSMFINIKQIFYRIKNNSIWTIFISTHYPLVWTKIYHFSSIIENIFISKKMSVYIRSTHLSNHVIDWNIFQWIISFFKYPKPLKILNASHLWLLVRLAVDICFVWNATYFSLFMTNFLSVIFWQIDNNWI